MEDKEPIEIIPDSGLWTVEGLSRYLKMTPSVLQQRLTDNGIKTMNLTNRPRHRLLSLRELCEKLK